MLHSSSIELLAVLSYQSYINRYDCQEKPQKRVVTFRLNMFPVKVPSLFPGKLLHFEEPSWQILLSAHSCSCLLLLHTVFSGCIGFIVLRVSLCIQPGQRSLTWCPPLVEGLELLWPESGGDLSSPINGLGVVIEALLGSWPAFQSNSFLSARRWECDDRT